ncbi:hypothetical protein A4G30_02060 [Mycobacterium kansasii]|uniref:Uncharacterized protein n=1 Tax=Mycobacterium kansasii TaxID=1768 RepID=A0A7G1IA51_MYCKA|nr:hypothetical protein A4G30_02060 [Mycobacterium kansasii]BCI87760.1 hypothetical protein NIIDMKKI_29660 [Mycobacterium kansasii]
MTEHRGGQGDDHHDGEHVGVENADLVADRQDHELGQSAGVYEHGDCGAVPDRHSLQAGTGEGAAKFSDAGRGEHQQQLRRQVDSCEVAQLYVETRDDKEDRQQHQRIGGAKSVEDRSSEMSCTLSGHARSEKERTEDLVYSNSRRHERRQEGSELGQHPEVGRQLAGKEANIRATR